MNPKKQNPNKELYAQLRQLPWSALWDEEVPRFNQAAPSERVARVSVVRAVGVVFSEAGAEQDRAAVQDWLRSLLRDPEEKVRRYAMAALPKIGAGQQAEAELLAVLKTSSGERERKYLGRALDKIGGAGTLKALESTPGLTPQTERKVKASLARQQNPGGIAMDRPLAAPGLRLLLHCRQGLETLVRDEVEASRQMDLKFQVAEVQEGMVALDAVAPFTLGEVYSLRCFASVGFFLAYVPLAPRNRFVAQLAEVITSPAAQAIFRAFTQGPPRYRLEFAGQGHQRGLIRDLANQAYARCPEILNDPRQAPWTVRIQSVRQGYRVELQPRLVPDPRFSYRVGDIPAASHPPLAACLARLAGPFENETVWDPFCGSGLELIEAARLGGVAALYGTDLDEIALEVAGKNLAASQLSTPARFLKADFRDFLPAAALAPGSVGAIVTNPPMGRRVPVGDLRNLMEELFRVAFEALRPGGRLVLANPIILERPPSGWSRTFRQLIDLGGMNCRVECYQKKPRS